MEWLKEIASFALETGLVVSGIVVVMIVFYGLMARTRRRGPHLEVDHLNERLRDLSGSLSEAMMNRKARKAHRKTSKKKRARSIHDQAKPRAFVLDFKGDIRARAADALRHEITALLDTATPDDEVVLRLESPGGLVPHYGLAASQLKRIKDAQIPLTICVDKVAASGGYMMACLADKLVAAPFAVVGSIGVAAPMPNIHRLLKKNNIDYEEYTAGEFKRTVTMLGEITPKGRKKFGEQMEETHQLFKRMVQEARPDLLIDEVATGEHWYAAQALEKKLVDELATSDEVLNRLAKTHELYALHYHDHRNLRDRMGNWAVSTLSELFTRAWDSALHSRQY